MFSKKVVFAGLMFIAGLAATLGIAMLSSSTSKADVDNGLGSNSIIGSWHVTVSFDDARPDVLALYTFNRDRTFTMAGSWPGQFGPGHGAWNESGDATASVNLTFFRLLYAPTESNATTGALGATFNGTLKVQANLTASADGQSFTGRYLLTSFDANGNLRNVTSGGFKATRVIVEPLQ